LPLHEMISAFRKIGYDKVASVEIFRPEYWERDPFELARDARAATERVIAEAYMAKIRIGIMGAGYIAGVHASVLARDERVQLSAIYDVDAQSAERLAGTYNCTAVAT